MKVAVQMTDMKERGDIKQEFESDFVMLVCLQDDGTGFYAKSTVLGEKINVFEVAGALGNHMANVIMEMSENREEMAELLAAFYARFTKNAEKKYHEMKEKAE